MVEAFSHGIMVLNMRDILSMIRKKDLEYLCGKMVESMKENGN